MMSPALLMKQNVPRQLVLPRLLLGAVPVNPIRLVLCRTVARLTWVPLGSLLSCTVLTTLLEATLTVFMF